MLSTTSESKMIKVRGHWIMYVWVGLFVFGGLFSCYILIYNGLKSESVNSILYLGGGLFFSPIFIYLALWIIPGYLPPGKVLFTVHTGSNGKIAQKKKNVTFSQIRKIALKRNPINLCNEIHIETYANKKVKLKTYNLLSEITFYEVVDEYIFPHLSEEAKTNFNHEVANDDMLKDIDYQRKNHHID